MEGKLDTLRDKAAFIGWATHYSDKESVSIGGGWHRSTRTSWRRS